MLPLQHILLPVDFSERCSGMAGYVQLLAKAYNTKISLLHVAESVFVGPTGAGLPPMPVETPEERLDELTGLLNEFAAKHFAGISTTCMVRKGDPALEIVDYAKTEGVDLIAMPTHGRGTFRQFLLGSITAKVIHDAVVPVLTGAHLETRVNGEVAKFSRILCSIGLDEHSRSTLGVAARLACHLGAKLGIVHVIPVQDARLAMNFGTDWESQLVGMCKAQIHELEQEVGTAADVFVKLGKPADVICRLAGLIHCDLVIAGRSAGAGDGIFNGNAYDIIRQSPCPVISV